MTDKRYARHPDATEADLSRACARGDLIRATVVHVVSSPDTNVSGFAILKVHVDNVGALDHLLVTLRGDFDSVCLTQGCRIAARCQRIARSRFGVGEMHVSFGTVEDYGEAAHVLLICRLGRVDKDCARKVLAAAGNTPPLKWLAKQDAKAIEKRFNVKPEQASRLVEESEKNLACGSVVDALCFKRGLGLTGDANYDGKNHTIAQIRHAVKLAIECPNTAPHYAYWHETLNVSATTTKPRSKLDAGDKKLVELFVRRPYLLASERSTLPVETVDAMVDARDDYTFNVYERDRLCAIAASVINRLVFGGDAIRERDQLYASVADRMRRDGNTTQEIDAVRLACDYARGGLYVHFEPALRAIRSAVESDPRATGRFTLASDTTGLIARQTLQRLTKEIQSFTIEAAPTDPAWLIGRIYPHETHVQQHGMEVAIKEITRGGNVCHEQPAYVRAQLGLAGHAADLQWHAIEAAYAHNLSLLTGGPGRGKSTVITRLVQDWLASDRHNRVWLLSPTHKAKENLQQKLGAIGISYQGRSARCECVVLAKFTLDVYEPRGWSKADDEHMLVCIDEASMVDTETMSKALERCAERPGIHVLIAGDDHQLPPIGNGNPFLELLKSDLPTTRLTHNFRTNRQALVDLFDGIVDYDRSKIATAAATKNSGINWQLRRDAGFGNKEIADAAVDAYVTLARQMAPKRPMLITPYSNPSPGALDKRLCTTKMLGSRIQDILMPWSDDMHDALASLAPSVRDRSYDLITKHGWEIRLAKSSSPEKNRIRIGSDIVICKQTHPRNDPDALLTNGMTAKVAGILRVKGNPALLPLCIQPQGVLPAPLMWPGPKPVEEYYALIHVEGTMQLFALTVTELGVTADLAYALTVHKAQGSEHEHVIVVMPQTQIWSDDVHPFVDKNLVYTAMTRAQNELTVIGRRETFEHAIRHPTRERLDGLSELV